MTTETKASSPPEANGNGPEETPSLLAKLVDAISEVDNVEKDGHNDFQNYDYASAEAILRATRKPLLERGVFLLASLEDVKERPTKTPKGKDTVITTVRVRFTLVDRDSDEQIVSYWAGTGDDPSDKGLYKAYTGAIKTFLRETFMLPIGDDPEADTRADERQEGDSSPQLPADEKLPDEFVAMLGEKVDKAGLSQHLPMKLRAFGVDAMKDLTVEQGRKLWAWTEEDHSVG